MANISGYIQSASSIKTAIATNDELYTIMATNSAKTISNLSKISNFKVNASTGSITGNLDGNATSATTVYVTQNQNNATHYLNFVDNNNTGSNKNIHTDPGITCNPSNNSITATTFVGALTGNATTATRATNIAGGAGGSIPYQSSSNTTALLANGSAGQVLTSSGTTAAPSWTNPIASQITITDTNTSSTFYPVFTSATGTQTLNADATIGPFSVNPNTGDLRLANTLKIVGNTTIGQVAVGINAGASQANFSTAIGNNSGTSSSSNCVAVGSDAGRFLQSTNAVAIGQSAGQGNSSFSGSGQGAQAIAIGLNAGVGAAAANSGQGENAIAIGQLSGSVFQGSQAIAIGQNAGKGSNSANFQGAAAIAIGANAANSNQGTYSIAIGAAAGTSGQGTYTTAIGMQAGQTSQGNTAVAVGTNAGQYTQAINAVAVGSSAGNTTQGEAAVAVGVNSGAISQGAYCVAVGINAGQTTQISAAVAIGNNAGRYNQAANAVAIGQSAGAGQSGGTIFQGNGAVAIGNNAGAGTTSGQGANAIAIGNNAGVASQTANSICLNASGNAINPNQSGFFVNPIRTTTATTNSILTYSSNEITATSVLTGFSYLQEVEDPMLLRMGRAGGLVGYNYDPAFVASASSQLIANSTYVTASYFYAGQVITSLGVGNSNAANIAAASTMRIGLYTGAGVLVASTATLIGSGGGTPTTFSTSTYNFFAVNSGTPYTIPTSGFYYLAVGAGTAATTATFPGMSATTGIINYPNSAAITNGAISGLRLGVFTTSGGAILPNSLNGVSVTNNGGAYLVAAI
jgi:hypothetical protein